jgi:dTDP-4-dehydrorhamnose reductase
MTRIIIFGKNGQVASNLLEIFAYDKNFEIFNYSSAEIDFNEIANLSVKLDELPTADFMINATAYNHVDQAEDEPIKADNINHQSVRIIANFCKGKSIKLIHYSTNYVFDGKGDDAYFEDNIENLKPLSIYGKSKLAGEKAIISSGCNYLIFRVATVFDLNKTNNFPAKIKELAQTRDELKIVNDQFTNPTNSYDIARSTKIIIEQIIASRKFKNGIYHMVSNKPASYYDIACEVLKSQKTKIIPVDSSLFPTKAARPKNGVLNCDKIKKDFGIEIILNYACLHHIKKSL